MQKLRLFPKCYEFYSEVLSFPKYLDDINERKFSEKLIDLIVFRSIYTVIDQFTADDLHGSVLPLSPIRFSL